MLLLAGGPSAIPTTTTHRLISEALSSIRAAKTTAVTAMQSTVPTTSSTTLSSLPPPQCILFYEGAAMWDLFHARGGAANEITLISPSEGWALLSDASDINDTGEIVARGLPYATASARTAATALSTSPGVFIRPAARRA